MAYRSFESPQLSRRALLRSGAWLTAGATLAGGPFSSIALARETTTAWPAVTSLIEQYAGARKVANMVATLGWGEKAAQVISQGTLAIGGEAKAGPDSLYRIYSMTKPITGMAAMILVDEGKIGLDQPLADVLPAYANMMVQKTYDGSVTDLVPAERPITMRMLLTHTAGLGYGIVQQGPIKDLYEEQGLIPGQVSRLPIPGLGRAKPVRGLDVFADRLAKAPLVLQPGTKWSYSVGLDLMGRVIEVASGQSFDDFLKDRIFDPAGMTSTWFTVPESEVGRLTTNYGIYNGAPLPMDPASSSIYLDVPAFPMGGAGLVSSPRDYDRFLKMLLGFGVIEGKRVMSEAAVRVGTSNLLPETATTKGTWVEGQGFGAGGRVNDGAYGWGGAAGTVAFVSYKAQLRANMMTQYMPSDAYPLHAAFPEAVLADLAAMTGL
ncbi:serine hydrolase domain-containing protein [Erythrobacter mangrovi]|uniref:Beta-lactamase family protein n=1 Tax=Erythrobacter mangrovi TaxID=2739433 RepID=A0A7D3XNE4_9SPHN|nr:serine hydrolase domain-containing protein [Erythrobacter mangrovi]QKG70274.1 beta-lactamase family protein [Erythrobacter mangrovi]